MPEMKNHASGSFCWADLATSDTDSAKAFYSGLFGWEAVDTPTDAGIPYTMLMKGGKTVGALYRMAPDGGGVPPHWGSYVTVEDIDAAAAAVPNHGGSVAEAKRRGGNLMFSPKEVENVGRFAYLQDPQGAVFAVIQQAHSAAE